ncbi:MAG: sugar ABC transporter ATP-binding protein [Devosiaceae bacterium]|nr:sugar ABC transporter ATP-binding protein [Devosiaceae bacterium MH13]
MHADTLTASKPSASEPAQAQALLTVDDVHRAFGGVKALDGAHFTLLRGESHALVGENGAGKSTLIKILSGALARDTGTITLEGAPYTPANPHDAKALGVQVVHQEFNLLNDLSVAENISIESLPRRFGLLDKGEMERRARQALDAIGLTELAVTTPVGRLGIAHKQLIEIARALQSDSKVLILDEPTATLTERETSRLFEIINDIKAKGVTIVFVSHHLDEVFAICDRVTIFRNGRTVTTENIADSNPSQVVQHMVGRSFGERSRDRETVEAEDPVVLRVDRVRTSVCPHEEGVSLAVKRGEIVGIAGLVGAGRTEFLRALFGADPLVSGEISLHGEPLALGGPADAIVAGIGFVTEDRKEEGLILSMDLSANTSMASLDAVSSAGLLNFDAERKMAGDGGARLDLKYSALSDPASSLSGGNQQKVVLAKWLARNPQLLLLDEPTRGVDVGAKAEIYTILESLANQGVSMLVVSSELPELMTLADRILVMADHAIQGELARKDFSQAKILALAYGQAAPDTPASESA